MFEFDIEIELSYFDLSLNSDHYCCLINDGFVLFVRACVFSRKRWEVDLLCAMKSDHKGSDMIINSWHPLKKLKELYLLQVAEFTELRGDQSSTQSVEHQPFILQWKGDRIECYKAKQKSELWLETIFYEIQQGLSLVTTVRRCSLNLIV